MGGRKITIQEELLFSSKVEVPFESSSEGGVALWQP